MFVSFSARIKYLNHVARTRLRAQRRVRVERLSNLLEAVGEWAIFVHFCGVDRSPATELLAVKPDLRSSF
eukprot:SAG31_NODE_13845_length_843_cov_0.889785_1_plen_69_part_10